MLKWINLLGKVNSQAQQLWKNGFFIFQLFQPLRQAKKRCSLSFKEWPTIQASETCLIATSESVCSGLSLAKDKRLLLSNSSQIIVLQAKKCAGTSPSLLTASYSSPEAAYLMNGFILISLFVNVLYWQNVACYRVINNLQPEQQLLPFAQLVILLRY